MSDRPFGHRTVQADGVAVKRGGVYHGAILLADGVGAATAAIYDGLDAGGDLIDYLSALTSSYDRHVYSKGIALREGLYVDVGSNVSKLTIFYEPPAGEEL